ncbi:MAG TPA: AMP-binding protein [Streptosporangiaceae bacterium]
MALHVRQLFAGDAPDQLLERVRVGLAHVDCVPTMYSAMLHCEARPGASSLRVCVSGGAAMPVEVPKNFEQKFDCIILEGYGLSETSPVASFNHPDKVRKSCRRGRPARFCAARCGRRRSPHDSGAGLAPQTPQQQLTARAPGAPSSEPPPEPGRCDTAGVLIRLMRHRQGWGWGAWMAATRTRACGPGCA